MDTEAFNIGLPTLNNIDKNSKRIVDVKKEVYLKNFSSAQKAAILSYAIIKNAADYLKKILIRNLEFYNILILMQGITSAVTLDHFDIITHIIDSVDDTDTNTLLKYAFEDALSKDKIEILKKLLEYYPDLLQSTPYKKIDYSTQNEELLSKMLGSFVFGKYLDGLKLIFKKKLSKEDINFYCRSTAKDNKPTLTMLFMSNFPDMLDPMSKGVVLINLADFGQKRALNLFFVTMAFTETDYIERALVKTARKGHKDCLDIVLAQPIEWSYELVERAIDVALLNKQDSCLFKLIQKNIRLFSGAQLNEYILSAYVNSCFQTVNKLLEMREVNFWGNTIGELLLLAVKSGDIDFVKSLFSLKEYSVVSPYKLRAYRLAVELGEKGMILFFEEKFNGIKNILKPSKYESESLFTEETNQILSFQFAKLKIKKEKQIDLLVESPKPNPVQKIKY